MDLVNDPGYRKTFVYGNILIEPEGAGNSQIVHYGGDSGDASIYRKGTLYSYNNTVVSTRTGNTTSVPALDQRRDLRLPEQHRLDDGDRQSSGAAQRGGGVAPEKQLAQIGLGCKP